MFKLIIKYIKRYKIIFINTFVFNIVITLTTILSPYILGKYIDSLEHSTDISNVYNFLFIFSSMMFIKILLSYFKDIYIIKLKTNVNFDLLFDLTKHLLRLPLSFFSENNMESSYLTQRINSDTNNVVVFILDNIFSFIAQLLSFIYIIYYMLNSNFKFSLILFLVIPIYIYI